MLTGILDLAEYSDPTAQYIELSVSDRIPVKFKVAFTSKGLIRKMELILLGPGYPL
jgi:hypothetical protein